MLQKSAGYPDLTHVSRNVMSLATPGVVSTPSFFKGPYLQNQHNYFKEGFQGLGFTTVPTASDYLSQVTSSVASVLPSDVTSSGVFAGSGGTLLLIGLGIGVYYLAKALGPEAQRKRAKAKFESDIEAVHTKYQKYGF